MSNRSRWLWTRPRPKPAKPTFRFVACSGLLIEFGDRIDETVYERVDALHEAVLRAKPAGVIEVIPSYTTLLLRFDPVAIDGADLVDEIRELAESSESRTVEHRTWNIPVSYGGELGFDLAEVAAHCGLSPEAVVARHAGATYTICMFGFLPGFAYLAGLPDELAMPRRTTPRGLAPGGIIAIGGAQTAIGSIAGPSGWNIIGQTPVRTFDRARNPTTFLAPGDRVRFVAIDAATYDALAERAAQGEIIAARAP